jgi:hypothetical protein
MQRFSSHHAQGGTRYTLTLALVCLALAACSQAAPPAPTTEPAAQPTAAPTSEPTVAPTAEQTSVPAATVAPTAEPTAAPAATVVPAATVAPTAAPATAIPGALVRGTIRERPYIVMIDNHPDAYPQSGLDQAAIVFEALAEFGLTRFMAVYAPGVTPDADTIGPVRSTRLYYAEWALPFGALYVHAGGSPQGLQLVETTDQLINVDALYRANSAYFHRDTKRAAPHNLYTSSAMLERAAAERGADQALRDDIGYMFKDEAAPNARPAAQQISYFFLYREDRAGWMYDPESNSYLRLRRGKPAVDAVTGTQLRSKNVVVMEIEEAPIAGDEKGRIEQQVSGTGRARVFLDGTEREVTWSKSAPEAPLLFLDSSGNEVRFNPGPIWIVALPSLDNLATS